MPRARPAACKRALWRPVRDGNGQAFQPEAHLLGRALLACLCCTVCALPCRSARIQDCSETARARRVASGSRRALHGGIRRPACTTAETAARPAGAWAPPCRTARSALQGWAWPAAAGAGRASAGLTSTLEAQQETSATACGMLLAVSEWCLHDRVMCANCKCPPTLNMVCSAGPAIWQAWQAAAVAALPC